MITENLSTLKIHKLTQEQYDRELAAGNIDETALYLTPDSGIHIASKTGESPVLNDSAAGGLKIDRICGGSKQETTSGNQLLDLRNGKGGTGDGVTLTNNGDGTYKMSGTATGTVGNVWLAGDYGIVPSEDNSNVIISLEAGTYTVTDCDLYTMIGGNPKWYGYTFTISETLKVTGVRNPNFTIGETYNKTIYPMLNKGSTALPWEPYTGNIPSPNPEYPQPIVSAGQMLVDGVVTDVGISKKLTGKNLLQNTAVSKTVNGVTFTVNNDKSITINGTNDNTNVSDLYIYGSMTDNGNYLSIPKGCVASFEGIQNKHVELICMEKETLTYNLEQLTNLLAERDCQFYGILLRVNHGVSANTTICPMIRHADIEDDTYEPYTEQTLTLNRVLRGIPLGTDIPEMFKSNALHMAGIYWDEKEQQYYIADTIDAERGVRVQRIPVKTVNNVNHDRIVSTHDGLKWSYGVYVTDSALHNKRNGAHASTMCDKFTLVAQQYENNESTGTCVSAYGHSDNLEFRFRLLQSEYPTEEDAANAINGTKVYYPIATPIETPLTDEEIIALHQLKTYQGVTHIFGSNAPDATMIFKYSSSEIGGVTLENSNLHAVNEVLRRRMLTHSDVVDNLASTDADVPLSANQGRVLKDELDDLKDEIPDVLPINKGGTGATDADTALANLGGAKASETIKTAFYDDAAENIGQLLDAKCAHARELNAPAVCIYGGWQNIDFGVFYAQVVNNVVQGIYVKGDTAYIVRCDNGTDTATYSKVALQSDIDAIGAGTEITDVTQITQGGMYHSNGNVANAPTNDGVYYEYFASKNGWIVSIIARSGSDGATYVSNNGYDGTIWTNKGWHRLITDEDIPYKVVIDDTAGTINFIDR